MPRPEQSGVDCSHGWSPACARAARRSRCHAPWANFQCTEECHAPQGAHVAGGLAGRLSGGLSFAARHCHAHELMCNVRPAGRVYSTGSGYHPHVHACQTPAHLHGGTAPHTSTAWLAPINMFVAVTPQTWRVCLTALPPGKGPWAACATTHAHRAGSRRSVPAGLVASGRARSCKR